jgi:hypothetical protein
LLAVAMLSQADEPCFGRGRAAGQGQYSAGIDLLFIEQSLDLLTGFIVSNRTAADNIHAEFAEIGGNITGTTDASIFAAFAQYGYRGFRADSLGITEYVTIQDKIADEQNFLPTKGFQQLYQTRQQIDVLLTLR